MGDNYRNQRIAVVAPFVLCRDTEMPSPLGHGDILVSRTYYVWPFVRAIQLPFGKSFCSYHDPNYTIPIATYFDTSVQTHPFQRTVDSSAARY